MHSQKLEPTATVQHAFPCPATPPAAGTAIRAPVASPLPAEARSLIALQGTKGSPGLAFRIKEFLPFVVGAAVLLTAGYDGLYWLAAGVVLVFIGSVTNAWVLMVEILR